MTGTMQRAPLASSGRDAHARARWSGVAVAVVIGLAGAIAAAPPAMAQSLSAPPSLRTIRVPEPDNLGEFVKSKPAAIVLGKALFWDMQVGADAVQSCASCHFHAGADNRVVNSVNPGLNRVNAVTLAPNPDATFQAIGPNGTLDRSMFPFTKFNNAADPASGVVRDWNDVVSSQGVFNTTFTDAANHGALDKGTPVPDPVFNVGGLTVRRVEPRNTPTVINAVFNFANFWDGRADGIFNGSSPFGDADPDAGVWVETGKDVQKVRVRIPYSSLASQSVGPPGSAFEMSFAGRSFPEIGQKLLDRTLTPLGKQAVHPRDSVLGGLARSSLGKNGKPTFSPGLNTTYAALVQAAFQDRYWSHKGTIDLPQGRFTQIEANFALFFGLAIQIYESTLVSDDSPYDRYMTGDSTAMSASAQEGLNIFLSQNEPGAAGGSCINCHGTSTFSNASVMHVGATNFGSSLPEALIERMTMGDGGGAFYDSGFYNIGVRPTEEDLGRGGKNPFGNPLSFAERAVQTSGGTPYPFPTAPLPCGPGFQLVCPSDRRVATQGSFKVPTLRNVELTGPYMHNGGEATLAQVMEFYARGGNFRERNAGALDPDIEPLFGLNAGPLFTSGGGDVAQANQHKLIDFLAALTDERVRWERAPFDHPQLLIPNGANLVPCAKQPDLACDSFLTLPAVGADGLAPLGLPPLDPFMGLDPHRE